ncbi:MAG: hypothetical protein P8X68_08060 [Desulfobacterales bacterium]|jgi:hypothetical protein
MNKLKCVVCVVLFLTLGCAGIQTGKRMTLFDDTARAYLRSIRWGDYEAAYAFKNPQTIDRKMPDFEDLRQIRVTAYNVKQTILSEDKTTILRIVDFQYYRTSNVTVKNLIDRQKWEYDPEENRWYLTSGLPDFE